MSMPPADSHDPTELRPGSPPRNSLRSLLLLLVAASALMAFIAGVGDFRRKQNAIAQMLFNCATYTARMGNTNTLPLNLEPDVAVTRQDKMIKVFWITREDARTLRGQTGKIIAAYSGPIPRALSANGRVIAYFEGGSFGAEWLTLDEFSRRWKKQQETVRRLAKSSG